ncbi:GntR family transcriptional regulator [Cryobacterium sp. Y50]|uniref:GntR family transcriptional regulator n=1 Tax=Cryobacterium sp. Y50 TaxID=2048286 RepID=UPI000CE3DBDF|nr:GntR family transcriptional regulator [Cryobacterium sp. Y50]
MLATPGNQPLYRQIAADLWNRIRTGTLRAGEQMPNETALSEEFSVNRLTVRQAVAELQRVGAVEIRRGIGTFVTEPPDLIEVVSMLPVRAQQSDSTHDALSARGPSAVSGEPLRSVIEQVESFGLASGVDAAVAARHLDSGPADIYRLDTTMIRDGRPWILNSYWLPSDFAAAAEHLPQYGLVVHALKLGLGFDLHYRWRAFSASAADFDEAARLKVAAGSPLLVRDGVTAVADGRAAFFVRRRMRGDTAKFVLRYAE